jgi:hypothetical protein
VGDGNWHMIFTGLQLQYRYDSSAFLGYEQDNSWIPWVAFTY